MHGIPAQPVPCAMPKVSKTWWRRLVSYTVLLNFNVSQKTPKPNALPPNLALFVDSRGS